MSNEYHRFRSEGANGVIIPMADIIAPEYLELCFTDPARDNVQDVKKLVLNMKIGGVIIQQFPLSLLTELHEPIMCDGKMHIHLCFDVLFGDIARIGLLSHEVVFSFSSNVALSCIMHYCIVGTLTYVSMLERRNLQILPREHIIHQITLVDASTDIPLDKCMLELPFSHISKGFFIECENINNLNSILLHLNQEERFKLDRLFIRTKCKQITQNLIYFPFNYEVEYTDRTRSSFEGAINLSMIDHVCITLQFDIGIKNMKIYNLHANLYRQAGGMGGLVYGVNGWKTVTNLRDPIRLGSDSMSRVQRQTWQYQFPSSTGQSQPIQSTPVQPLPIHRPIVDVGASICPILLEPINAESKYMSCQQCKNNFSEPAIVQWFTTIGSTRIKTCPMCRGRWSNFEIYING